MRMLIPGRWTFAPRLVPGLATLLAIALFSELGFWQLQRAEEAQASQTARLEQERLPPVVLGHTSAGRVQSMLWRSARVSGTWLAPPGVLLDNQTLAGRVGYLVFAVLRPEGCACALLVDRGWIDAGPDRTRIPQLGRLPDATALRGRLAPLPPAGVGVRNDVEQLPGGLLRVQRIEAGIIPLEPGVRLLPATLRLDPEMPDGFVHNLTQQANKADRHLAYAVQWFIFALLAAGLYVFLHWKSR